MKNLSLLYWKYDVVTTDVQFIENVYSSTSYTVSDHYNKTYVKEGEHSSTPTPNHGSPVDDWTCFSFFKGKTLSKFSNLVILFRCTVPCAWTYIFKSWKLLHTSLTLLPNKVSNIPEALYVHSRPGIWYVHTACKQSWFLETPQLKINSSKLCSTKSEFLGRPDCCLY